MPYPTAVILVVGLSQSLLGEHSPRLSELARRGILRRLRPVLPAVTCSVQSSMLTGLTPREHGIVGNGWYNREQGEVQFWKQSNSLVAGEKVWETARVRDSSVTCANICWWYNMNTTADFTVTPRPIYTADGRKIPDCYTQPAGLREALQSQLGQFPLFHFWGPGASIESSRWIARAAEIVYQHHKPTLSLVYLPHLDYALQKLGPRNAAIPAEVRQIDDVAGRLIEFYRSHGVRVMIVSEYGIAPVDCAIDINRILRQRGLLHVREELGRELLDPLASDAFAVADHQVAHVYLRNPAAAQEIADLCRSIEGVEHVLDRAAQHEAGIDHHRAGDLVLVAAERHWFSYRYWLDDRRAPDFARTVEIHRKPGYDPLELFLDPEIRFPKLRIARKLLWRRLGGRSLLDVIPLNPSLVRGSHGRTGPSPSSLDPVLITSSEFSRYPDDLDCRRVRDVILDHLFEERVP